jgi:filamentous hemagglutinin family protein
MLKNLYKSVSLTLVICLVFLPVRGFALPEGESIAAGNGAASFDRTSVANTLNIGSAEIPTSNRVIIDYTGFDINTGETVNFHQPNSGSIAVNRVAAGNPSDILGALNANGRIFILNPSGVLFGAGSQVNAGGLLASTLTMSTSDKDFMGGTNFLEFYTPAETTAQWIGNEGNIYSSTGVGEFVALLAPHIDQFGVISQVNNVVLASGNAMSVSLDPGSFMNVVITQEANMGVAVTAGVINGGEIHANDKVLLTAKVLDSLFDNAINNSGIIEAKDIEIIGNGDVAILAGSKVTARNFQDEANVKIQSTDGDISINGAEVTAEIAEDDGEGGSGDAQVMINAGSENSDIEIDGSQINARVSGSGMANIEIEAGEHGFNSGSDEDYSYSDEWLRGGTITISDQSKILADIAGFGESYVRLDAGGVLGEYTGPSSIYVNDSKVGAYVNNGWAHIDIRDAYSLWHESEDEYGWENDEDHLGGHIELNRSIIEAEARDGEGKDDAEIYMTAGAVTLNDTDVTAKVVGEGYAEVDIDAFYSYQEDEGWFGYYYDDVYVNGGTLDVMNNSNILATTKGGDVGVYLEAGPEEYWPGFEGPLPTYINIAGSTVKGIVDGLGHAEVYIGSDYSELDLGILDEVVDMFDFDLEDIGGPIYGRITVTDGSTVLAQSQGPMEYGEPGTAVVAIATADNLTIADSTVSAADSEMAGVALYAEGDININGSSKVSAATTAEESIAGVVAFAEGSINADAAIVADGGEGFGVAALLAEGNILAGNVSAKGGSDVMPMAEWLLSDYLGSLYVDAYLELFPQFGYGSGVLLGSQCGDIILGNVSADMALAATLDGSIYQIQDGLVSGHLLGLVADNNIGSLYDEEIVDVEDYEYDIYGPIKTDVDIVAAYSFGCGDIVIDEANDLQAGLVLPVTVHDSETSSIDAILGVAVAANQGNIFIRSQGDMLVNSVMAPNGGIFLQSEHGSIYAGKGWDPFYPVDLASILFDFNYLSMLNECVGYAPAVFTFANPEFGGTPYNFMAGGYSYISTPEGTIGVGAPDNKDPSISGEVAGMVWPDLEAVTGVCGPGLDLSRYTPPGLVYFYNENIKTEDPKIVELVDDGESIYEGNQIWPALIAPEVTSGNPLLVYVDAWKTGSMGALPDWFVDSLPETDGDSVKSFSYLPMIAGLTLEIGPPPLPVNPTALLANALMRDMRTYYEVMSGTRFQSIEPATPTNFLSYHPLVPTDMSAFDDIVLDAGAYDFISDNIKSKKKMAPYYGL